MLRVFILSALLLLLVPAVCAASRDANASSVTPIIKTVDPDSMKAGTEAVASGSNLDKAQVAAVYLSQGDVMVKVSVSSETDTELKFTVPETIKAGRYGLTVLTTGKEPRYIDEPLVITVE